MTHTVLVGWALLAFALALLWARQVRTRNATSVDAAWSVGIALLAVYYASVTDGDVARRVVVAMLGSLWAGRLAYHLLANRVFGHTEEDGRYRAMRDHWGERAHPWFFLFYQGQAIVAVLFSLPMLAAMRGGSPGPAVWAGVLVWLVAVAGETIADRQLARFRADPATRSEVCRVGLWRYSRHPNYFFEWIHWWAYVLIGGGAPLTWIGPVFMLLFLFRLTGIPYTEMQAIRSRGEAYRVYQRTTSPFFLWPPKDSG
jgi:steroid 5-alpha reductase family enzyme